MPALRGEAFNFSNELQLSVLELVQKILDALEADFEPLVLGTASHEIRHQYLSAEKAAQRARLATVVFARRRIKADDRVVQKLSGTCMQHLHAACRSCGQIGLTPILSLGTTPLANRLLSADQLELEEPKYPLDLVVCPGCALVQITETVPAEELFGEYAYFSSFSDSMLAHSRQLVERVIRERKLNCRSLVIEIASNDGYLLQYYRHADVPVLGIEPARQRGRACPEQPGDSHPAPLFLARVGAATSKVAANRPTWFMPTTCLPHVADLNGFVAGLRTLLKPSGVGILEVPYVRDLVERVEFDTIYHEHLCYFSLTSLEPLVRRARAGRDRRRTAAGARRLAAAVRRAQGRPSPSVRHLLTEEAALGVDRAEYYRDFGRQVEKLRSDLVLLLRQTQGPGLPDRGLWRLGQGQHAC